MVIKLTPTARMIYFKQAASSRLGESGISRTPNKYCAPIIPRNTSNSIIIKKNGANLLTNNLFINIKFIYRSPPYTNAIPEFAARTPPITPKATQPTGPETAARTATPTAPTTKPVPAANPSPIAAPFQLQGLPGCSSSALSRISYPIPEPPMVVGAQKYAEFQELPNRQELHPNPSQLNCFEH